MKLKLNSSLIAFETKERNRVQIEETKGKGDDSVVFSKIKPGINGVILNCNNGCPVGPQIANWGFKIINFRPMQNFKCACGGTLD